jgi:hypothetical protein
MQASVPKEWGGLAVIWDKNEMEASGYAAVMADLCNEKVYMTPYFDSDTDSPVKWIKGTFTPDYLPPFRVFEFGTNLRRDHARSKGR